MDFADLSDTINQPLKDKGFFSERYVTLRQKENWLSSDKEVHKLPDVDSQHTHYTEWVMRKKSYTRLFNYLKKKNIPLNILEIGCGNGWLSYQLAKLDHSSVTGIDINPTELNQAKRVFAFRSNLRFMLCDIFTDTSQLDKYDVVVLAASAQYFNSLKDTIQFILSNLLKEYVGEIHILDSPLYNEKEVLHAKMRSMAYYTKIGFPEMNKFYFHHTFQELKQFRYKVLYNPTALYHKFSRKHNPFYWLYIKNR